MSAVKPDPEIATEMFKPVLIRAGIALIFGVVSLVAQEPGTGMVNYGIAIYLVFSGSAMWEYLRRECVPEKLRSPLSMAAAVWMMGAICLVGVQLFDASVMASGIVTAVVFGLGGIAEIVAWAKYRKSFVPAKDLIGTGAVGVVTGLGLAATMISRGEITTHQVLGTTGTLAYVIAVVCAVSGIGFYLDARKAERS